MPTLKTHPPEIGFMETYIQDQLILTSLEHIIIQPTTTLIVTAIGPPLEPKTLLAIPQNMESPDQLTQLSMMKELARWFSWNRERACSLPVKILEII